MVAQKAILLQLILAKLIRQSMTQTLPQLGWGLALLGILSPTFALALDTSVGDAGIDAYRLHRPPYNLTGRKIAIGQVEIGRPGKFGFDKVVSWNPALSLARIYYINTKARSNTHLDNHAMMVANVMVSQAKGLPGVAPQARLYATAIGPLKAVGQPEECLAAQHIALQNGTDVRAINFSFGEPLTRDPRNEPKLDGNALLTQCIDWSSRVHNTLYVIAGNQGKGGIPIPTDHFNGITTAYSSKRQGKFIKVDFGNLSSLPVGIGRRLIQQEIDTDGRRAIGLIAPGHRISVYDLRKRRRKVTGTSFAAPHITASVALLQEFGDRQLRQNAPYWSLDSRRHEVTKAILLNSADKLQDQGDGLRLGMTRTVLTKKNLTWLNSKAYRDPVIPLDIEMGTGHLNVFRAYQQFKGGQWKPEQPVAPVGWDYGTVKVNQYQDYILEKPLKAQGFVAITLAWDRVVELKDTNGNQQYDKGETFSDHGLNQLHLYLMSVEENNDVKSVCASLSRVDSVQHIFCKIPQTGRYKIRVKYHRQANQETQSYGLAWWTVPRNE
jgi:subtilisin family serine protease